MAKKSGSEPWSVEAVKIEGDASCAYPFLHEEVATTTVDGIGKVRVAMSIGVPTLYVMLPRQSGVAHDASPPTLYSLPLMPLMQAAIGAAVERYKTGEPAVWEDVPMEPLA